MTILVLLVLGGVWAAYLIPPMLQNRGVGSRRSSGNGLSAIGAATSRMTASTAVARPVTKTTLNAGPSLVPAPSPDSLMPRTAAEARQRRTLVIGVLGALAVVSLLAIPALGVPALFIHLTIDVMLAGVVYLMYQRNGATGASGVVRSLDFHRQIQGQKAETQAPENELARRIAN